METLIAVIFLSYGPDRAAGFAAASRFIDDLSSSRAEVRRPRKEDGETKGPSAPKASAEARTTKGESNPGASVFPNGLPKPRETALKLLGNIYALQKLFGNEKKPLMPSTAVEEVLHELSSLIDASVLEWQGISVVTANIIQETVEADILRWLDLSGVTARIIEKKRELGRAVEIIIESLDKLEKLLFLIFDLLRFFEPIFRKTTSPNRF